MSKNSRRMCSGLLYFLIRPSAPKSIMFEVDIFVWSLKKVTRPLACASARPLSLSCTVKCTVVSVWCSLDQRRSFKKKKQLQVHLPVFLKIESRISIQCNYKPILLPVSSLQGTRLLNNTILVMLGGKLSGREIHVVQNRGMAALSAGLNITSRNSSVLLNGVLSVILSTYRGIIYLGGRYSWPESQDLLFWAKAPPLRPGTLGCLNIAVYWQY